MPKTKSNDKVIRSRSHDTQWFFALAAAVRTLELVQTELADRIDIMGERQTVEALHDEALRVVNQIKDTFPPEKVPTIERQMSYLYYKIEVNKPAAGWDKYHTIMDGEDLGTLIKFAHNMNCTICSHPTWCGNRCALGKVFDRILPESRSKKESWMDKYQDRDD